MIVLGLDPGTRHTGYGVVERRRGTLYALDYGTLDLAADLDHTLRLQKIYQMVIDAIGRSLPDEVAVEMPIYGKNPQSLLKLGRAQAAIMLAAVHREVPMTQYTPAEVKKSVTGNGNAAKEQVWYMVQQELRLTESRGLDASDALAVALCHSRRITSGPPAPAGTKRGSTGPAKNWAAFVAANPDRIR